ncbi:MAG: 3-phosphoserine/phosphohydroxythreonine transaminase [Deltaproteobacteria bacterium]|nr:MAG: 3-phosphoserine/phosphohydroxythreonine transaminase [Deltaproteobacteria bacterium]
MTRKLNFSSGPATLPEPVLRRAQAALWDLDGSGIGILEHSHRGPTFRAVLERTTALVREVGGIGDDHAVLFLTAGATAHFTLVPQNFLGENDTADVCHTGVWSGKVIEETRRFGKLHLACNGGPAFDATPEVVSYSAAPRYVHYISNETVYGTQWRTPPANPPAPLVCDASSDIFSRPLPLAGHALIFAGAQKNLGPSGISLVIARKDFLTTRRPGLPPLADYLTYDRESSMPNTPNTFGIYMIGEVVAWIRDQGGLAAMAERSARKARMLYDFLDGSRVWRGHAGRGSRSNMNVAFRGATPALEAALLARAEQRGMSGLAGHRSVGGLRASLYNALPEHGVRSLVELLAELERENGTATQ